MELKKTLFELLKDDAKKYIKVVEELPPVTYSQEHIAHLERIREFWGRPTMKEKFKKLLGVK